MTWPGKWGISHFVLLNLKFKKCNQRATLKALTLLSILFLWRGHTLAESTAWKCFSEVACRIQTATFKKMKNQHQLNQSWNYGLHRPENAHVKWIVIERMYGIGNARFNTDNTDIVAVHQRRWRAGGHIVVIPFVAMVGQVFRRAVDAANAFSVEQQTVYGLIHNVGTTNNTSRNETDTRTDSSQRPTTIFVDSS